MVRGVDKTKKEILPRIETEQKVNNYDKLHALAYSAIGAMMCGDYNGDNFDDLAEYLGCTVDELKELGLID